MTSLPFVQSTFDNMMTMTKLFPSKYLKEVVLSFIYCSAPDFYAAGLTVEPVGLPTEGWSLSKGICNSHHSISLAGETPVVEW